MSKRGAREGEIVHRKDGRWEGRVTVGTQGRRKSVYGKTRGEAMRKLGELARAEAQGVVVDGRQPTVSQFLNRWLTEVADESVRPSTARRYRDVVNLYLSPTIGSIALDRLGPQQIQSMVNEQAAAGLATEKIRAVLRNGLNVAIKWRLMTWNPAELVDLPRRVARKPRFLTVEEAERLLDTVRGDRLEALYVMALSLAMREGELLGLRWSDIDLAAGELRITNQLQNGQLVDVKSAASHRWLPMPEIVRAALVAHREHERLTSIDRLVFTSTVGTPIGARNLLRAFKVHLRRAGLPEKEIRFHDLRHSAATFLIARGSDPKTVQAILGHTTVRLTMDTYVHAMPQALRDAARQMDSMLSAHR